MWFRLLRQIYDSPRNDEFFILDSCAIYANLTRNQSLAINFNDTFGVTIRLFEPFALWIMSVLWIRA